MIAITFTPVASKAGSNREIICVPFVERLYSILPIIGRKKKVWLVAMMDRVQVQDEGDENLFII